MKTTRELSRLAVARRLQDMALRIASGRPIRVGGVSVRVPERIVVEEELETKDGETEFEVELKWPAAPARTERRARGQRGTRSET
jgi:amphi-Trp domain-containing protein